MLGRVAWLRTLAAILFQIFIFLLMIKIKAYSFNVMSSFVYRARNSTCVKSVTLFPKGKALMIKIKVYSHFFFLNFKFLCDINNILAGQGVTPGIVSLIFQNALNAA